MSVLLDGELTWHTPQERPRHAEEIMQKYINIDDLYLIKLKSTEKSQRPYPCVVVL